MKWSAVVNTTTRSGSRHKVDVATGNLAEVGLGAVFRIEMKAPMDSTSTPDLESRTKTQTYHCHRVSDPTLLLVRLFIMAYPAPSAILRHCCSHAYVFTRGQKRSLSSQCLRITSATQSSRSQRQRRRWQSTDAGASAPENPKIVGIVDQISQLTLLETADLVQSLKVSYRCDALHEESNIALVTAQYPRHLVRSLCLSRSYSSSTRRRRRGSCPCSC